MFLLPDPPFLPLDHQAIDDDANQTAQMLAGLLDCSQVTQAALWLQALRGAMRHPTRRRPADRRALARS